MTGYLLVAAVVAVISAITGVAKGIPRMQARRERTARARAQLAAGVSDLRDGELATLRGVATPVGEPLASPLSGTPCVAYAASVAIGYARRKLMSRDYVGRNDYGVSAMCGFVVDTGNARVTVEGDRVVLDIPLMPVIPEEPARSMKFAKVDVPNAVSAPYEAIVGIGANIAVSGRVVLERIAPTDGGYRDEPVRARLVGTLEHPITIAAR